MDDIYLGFSMCVLELNFTQRPSQMQIVASEFLNIQETQNSEYLSSSLCEPKKRAITSIFQIFTNRWVYYQ